MRTWRDRCASCISAATGREMRLRCCRCVVACLVAEEVELGVKRPRCPESAQDVPQCHPRPRAQAGTRNDLEIDPMWQLGVDPLELVARTAIVYALFFGALRLSGASRTTTSSDER